MTDAPADLLDPAIGAFAARFGVDGGARLGEGGETVVFALDEQRVLRVYRGGTPEYVARLAAFYEGLDGSALPFALPRILEWGEEDGRLYAIQPRIPGVALSYTLPAMSKADREAVLTDYLDATLAIRSVHIEADEFGEILADGPLRRADWPSFLRDRARAALTVSLPDLRRDLPDIDAIVERFEAALPALADVERPELVHGDLFPGNVMADGTRISGVIDFSPLTVAGDWRMDVAGALAFLEVVQGYRESDSRFLGALVRERAPAAVPLLDLYRTYYALYFSFAKQDSPRLYEWCVRSLRDVWQRGGLAM